MKTSILLKKLLACRSDIVAKAQEIYDEWTGKDDEVYGNGGICDAIAEAMGNTLASAGIDTIDGGQDGDDHAYLIAYDDTHAYIVDIPPGVYERGGGYSWMKIEGVTIDLNDIVIEEAQRKDLDIDSYENNPPDSLLSYRDLPADPDRGNPLQQYGAIHADKLGSYWTVPTKVPIRLLPKAAAIDKARLKSVREATKQGKALPPVEVAVWPSGASWIVDGNHRIVATAKEGAGEIDVIFTWIGDATKKNPSGKLDDIHFKLTRLDGGGVVRIEASPLANGDIVGFLHLYRYEHGYLTVDQLWVDQKFQRRGVATEMYRMAIEYARRRGDKIVSIPDARTDASNALHEVLQKKFPHERKQHRFEAADVYSNPSHDPIRGTRDPGTRYADSPWQSASFRQICEALSPVIANSLGTKWPLEVKAATCDQADREHAKSDRQYCHVGHRKNTICYSHHIAEVSPNYKLGLAIHEFGHLILQACGRYEHSEQEANDVGGQAVAIKVEWRSDRQLEWAACPAWFKELL